MRHKLFRYGLLLSVHFNLLLSCNMLNSNQVKLNLNEFSLTDLKRSSNVLLHKDYIVLSITDASESLNSKSSLFFFNRQDFSLIKSIPYSGTIVKFNNDTLYYDPDKGSRATGGFISDDVPKGFNVTAALEPIGSMSSWQDVIIGYEFYEDSVMLCTRKSENLFAARQLKVPVTKQTLDSIFESNDSLFFNISEIGLAFKDKQIWITGNANPDAMRLQCYLFCNQELQEKFYKGLFQFIRDEN